MDATDWDDRYRTAEYVWHTEPNRFLPELVEGLTPGTALDLACGEGRNAVWLATQGWAVTGVDFSSVALAKAERLAADHGVTATWEQGDVTTWTGPTPFDLVVVFYLQLAEDARRRAMAAAAAALAPGGTLIVVAHDLANLTEGVGGPQHPSVLPTADDVVADLDAAAVPGLVVERAERIRRPVATDGGPQDAIDCLVRARRSP